MGENSAERPRGEWKDYLDRVTKAHEQDDITIELLSPEFGDQQQVERLPLAYVEYDDRDDVVIVAVGGRDGRFPVVLRHMIWRPRALLADPPDPESTKALEIINEDDERTIVSLFPS